MSQLDFNPFNFSNNLPPLKRILALPTFSIRIPPVAKIALILIYHEVTFTKILGLV